MMATASLRSKIALPLLALFGHGAMSDVMRSRADLEADQDRSSRAQRHPPPEKVPATGDHSRAGCQRFIYFAALTD
jgi:hypothetical protein